ncbi:MAG: glycosyltransferase [Oligoflexales bacterium]|nr:glycosyltransferase [Oligoflexales bacterium]
MKNEKISVILPTYNEVSNINDLIIIIRKKLCEKNSEIIIVDDGSTDGTVESVRKIVQQYENIKLIERNGKRPSLAGSILDGINVATGEVLLIMDSDFNHSPEYCSIMCNQLNENNIVIGSRFVSNISFKDLFDYRYIGSWLVQVILKFITGLQAKDCLCGFFCIYKRLIDELDCKYIFKGYGDYFIYLLIALQRKRVDIVEIPVSYGKRRGGKSKTKLLKYFFVVIKEGWRAKRNLPRN